MKPCKIKEIWIEQMGWARIHQCAKHLLAAARMVCLPSVDKGLYLLTLQPVLTATKIAWDDGIVHRLREGVAIGLRHMGERAINKDIALFIKKLWRHRRETRPVEQVHEKRLEDVIAVMAEDHSRTTFFPGNSIEISTAKPRA